MRNKLLVFASLFIIASMVLGACATPPAATPEKVVEKVVETVVVEKRARQSSSPPPLHPPRNGSQRIPPPTRGLHSVILRPLTRLFAMRPLAARSSRTLTTP